MTPSRQWAWSLRWIYQPLGKEKLFFIMRDYAIHALFDESGTERDCDCCLVAGFMGTVKQRSRFEKVWRPHATSVGFHAKRFFARDSNGNRISPYDGWSPQRSAQYYRGLLRAIEGAKLTPLVSAIDSRAFWRFSEEERHKLTGAHWREGELKIRLSGAPTNPYYLPFEQVINKAVRSQLLKQNKMGIYFSFDENMVLEAHARTVYRRIKNSRKEYQPQFAEKMKGIIFESDADNIGLQAADLLAYAWFQQLTHREAMPSDLVDAFHVFERIDPNHSADFWTESKMRQLLSVKPDWGYLEGLKQRVAHAQDENS